MKKQLLAAMASLLVYLLAAGSEAAVIYSEDFAGTGAPLHGKVPTEDNSGGANTWNTRTVDSTPTGEGLIFYDDGTIFGPDTLNHGNATLPFVPQSGLIYTLTGSFGETMSASESNNWVGFGFALGGTNGASNDGRFIGPGGSAGQPWMLYRGSGDGRNNTADDPDQTFLGPGTGGVADWGATFGDNGDPIDMRITLDTTGSQWVAQWYAKAPSDPNYTLLRTEVYADNPSIGAVGYTISALDVISSINSFELTVVPEPGTCLLFGLGILLGSVRMRSKR